jgi:hypothetical protein
MEELSLELNATRGGMADSPLFAGGGFLIRHFPADMDTSWHPSPRRQLAVTIEGEGEMETSDGQVLVLKPGVLVLLEDVTGQGHLTRARGNQERTALILPINDAASFT